MAIRLICLFAILSLTQKLAAQRVTPSSSGNVLTIPATALLKNPEAKDVNVALPQQVKPFMLSSSFYSQHIGLFCKGEMQLEKSTRLPLRLRLGSLDYTNLLEGKGSGRQ